ncbi:MAG: 50S ribosomal protein L35 [Bdellovibrionaceae bacterium]|nr:50S ribosomal protein L35 [Pseudobdellovibrionaceae bacterium]
MPKIKTKSSAKKRFKLTGSGNVKRAKANLSHLLNHKPSKRTRRLRQMALVNDADLAQVKRMLVK